MKRQPNPFDSDKLPSSVEDFIVDKYSDHCVENDSEDLLESELLEFCKIRLDLPVRLVDNINPASLVIEGTNVLDFDRFLQTVGPLVMLLPYVSYIDSLWKMFVGTVATQVKDVFRYRIHLDDMVKIRQAINDSAPTGVLLDMVSLASNGQRVYVNYADFAIILGKIGELN